MAVWMGRSSSMQRLGKSVEKFPKNGETSVPNPDHRGTRCIDQPDDEQEHPQTIRSMNG